MVASGPSNVNERLTRGTKMGTEQYARHKSCVSSCTSIA